MAPGRVRGVRARPGSATRHAGRSARPRTLNPAILFLPILLILLILLPRRLGARVEHSVNDVGDPAQQQHIAKEVLELSTLRQVGLQQPTNPRRRPSSNHDIHARRRSRRGGQFPRGFPGLANFKFIGRGARAARRARIEHVITWVIIVVEVALPATLYLRRRGDHFFFSV